MNSATSTHHTPPTDWEKARYFMVEQQIRPWDVLDQRILELLSRMRREDFVPAAHQSLAFVDMEIPLNDTVSMWPPRLEARAVQSLDLLHTDRVLEVGTGSGFVTTLLANLVAEVVSVEIDPDLAAAAAAKLAAHGLSNVTLRSGDAARDWTHDGTFDAILLTGSVPVLPQSLLARLQPGGRLFAIVGSAPVMQAMRVTAMEGGYRSEVLFDTCVAELTNAEQAPQFVF
jgi:protein-L-isoaspartate(D-aspartate) O-methyltransferase